MSERTLFGIPIHGSPNIDKRHTIEQRPGEDLAPLFKAVWDCGGSTVRQLVWTQYIPYFNDGEPCIFGVSEIRFLTQESAVSNEDEEYGQDIGSWNEVWQALPEPLKTNLKVLADTMSSGHYDDALYEAFGDHCEVTAHPDRFVIDSYSHD